MKNIFTLISFLLCTFTLFAQAPELVNYQAVVRDGEGELLIEKKVAVRIRILKDSEFGASVYVERHLVESNTNGLITLQIGNGEIIEGMFSEIQWAEGNYFIQTEIDPNGGSNYSISGVSQLLSVPYALFAKESGDNVFLKVGEEIIYTDNNVGIGTNEPTEKLHVNGNIKANGNLKLDEGLFADRLFVNPNGNGPLSYLIFRNDTYNSSPRMFHNSNDNRIHFSDISGMSIQGGLNVIGGGVIGEGDFRTTGHMFINTDNSSNIPYVVFRGTTHLNNPRMFYRGDQDFFAFSGASELVVDGDFRATGTKNFIQEHPNDPSKQIRYTALEAGEAGTYWRGSAKTQNKRVVIDLPEHFSFVTSEEGLTVNLTPRNGWPPLYVESVSTTKLIVAIDDSYNQDDVEFDFLINGLRLGYENVPVIEPKTIFDE